MQECNMIGKAYEKHIFSGCEWSVTHPFQLCRCGFIGVRVRGCGQEGGQVESVTRQLDLGQSMAPRRE